MCYSLELYVHGLYLSATSVYLFLFFFFFQAEDGIRDLTVTWSSDVCSSDLIWPAMLLAADLELPRLVWAHGYVQWEGAKMSKTAGTAVDLGGAIARYGPDEIGRAAGRGRGWVSGGGGSFKKKKKKKDDVIQQ